MQPLNRHQMKKIIFKDIPIDISDQNVLIVKSPKHPMSNYFPCHIKMHNIYFPSSEHAYQWRFLRYIEKSNLADEVMKAPTAAEAK